MASKILVVGSVNGQLDHAFKKIAKLHTKTDFAFALIVGDLFSEESNLEQVQALLDGSITVPLPVYFTVGNSSLPKLVQDKLEAYPEEEICPNLVYLGRRGTFKTSEGIRIVYLGGQQVENEGASTQGIGKYDPLFLENEVRALQGAQSSDILLTNVWPAGIENGSNATLPDTFEGSRSSSSVANLCATLKPRYSVHLLQHAGNENHSSGRSNTRNRLRHTSHDSSHSEQLHRRCRNGFQHFR